MRRQEDRYLLAALALAVLALSGCATSPVRPVSAPDVALGPPAEAPTTPPAGLNWAAHRAERHLVAGIAAYEAKRPDEAREEFAEVLRAFDAPGIDVENDAAARAAYRRFLERVSTYDVDALAAQSREEIPLEMLSGVEFFLERPNPVAEEEIRQALRSITFDVPVQVNEEVLAFVDYFRTRHRGAIEAGLDRSGRYMEEMRRIFRDESVPQDLVYMALIESNYKPTARSRRNAVGIWQFIAETGRRYGLRQTSAIDERSDPEKSTRAAARYLKDLHGMFGDWYLAMAAYNCGEMKVAKELLRSTAKGFWDLSQRNQLPTETKRYVPAILAGMIISKNPQAFGFDVEPESPLRFDSVVLPVATDLRTIARKLETSVDYLRELNPEIRRSRTPTAPYALRVPPGRGDSLVASILAMPPEDRGGSFSYTVSRGDTLSAIAKRHGVSVAELADWNDLPHKGKLRPGAMLQIPARPGTAREEAARSTARQMDEAGRVASVKPAPAAGGASSTARGRRISYRVRKGDTLFRIARQYKVSIERLSQWNGGLGQDEIQPGDVLTIYVE